jgi:hypothetical protein
VVFRVLSLPVGFQVKCKKIRMLGLVLGLGFRV